MQEWAPRPHTIFRFVFWFIASPCGLQRGKTLILPPLYFLVLCLSLPVLRDRNPRRLPHPPHIPLFPFLQIPLSLLFGSILGSSFFDSFSLAAHSPPPLTAEDLAMVIMSKRGAPDCEAPAEEDLKRLAIKHAGLKQEYNDLQRETRALKKRLQRAKQKKDNLLAEVRFLRRRHKFLAKNAALEAQVNELQLQKPPLASLQDMKGEYGYELPVKKPQPSTTMAEYGRITGATSSAEESFRALLKTEPFSIVDLTHSPEKNPPAAREFQVFWEPLRTTGREAVPSYGESVQRNALLEKGGLASDLNLSIFKDIANGFGLPSRTGKRKISWQDQMALRV